MAGPAQSRPDLRGIFRRADRLERIERRREVGHELERHIDRGGTLPDLEFGEDVLEVHLDGFFADAEQHRNLFVAPAFGHQLHDLNLARRERRLRGAFVQPRLDVRPDGPSPGMHFPDEANEIVGKRVLE